ncbi:hypothetical protein HYH03_002457 [Edaphochlamys debaryana]|uniref:Uncharacterized protein n=1 Tax=Edaphochlamys debaryana TaxID=47281 RepID=A0A836C457_9CHLO|nr:hypothetical protein HYH03_002457 [Edaphochlamys debaryana]|eukprot:KAG2499510.1 hypothetical protein HYH03_002457 [Edaphochlamys debaryana]
MAIHRRLSSLLARKDSSSGAKHGKDALDAFASAISRFFHHRRLATASASACGTSCDASSSPSSSCDVFTDALAPFLPIDLANAEDFDTWLWWADRAADADACPQLSDVSFTLLAPGRLPCDAALHRQQQEEEEQLAADLRACLAFLGTTPCDAKTQPEPETQQAPATAPRRRSLRGRCSSALRSCRTALSCFGAGGSQPKYE